MMACYLLLTLHDQNTPWLIRAGYYLGEVYLARLVRPGSEKPFTHKVTYFSRLFLSNCLGGSQYPTYTKVTLDRNHVYHLADYYVGKLEWNSQYPKKVGENGALLLVGRNFANPPVPWGLTEGTLFVGHRATPIPINCFIKRDSAEYEYLGCYVIHNEFRKLTDNEVEKNVPKATQELWEHGINSTQWGAKLKYKSESRKADELFKLEDDEPSKLCYYWQVCNYLLVYHDLLMLDISIWNTLDTTNAYTMLSVRKENKSAGRPGKNVSLMDQE
jgi:hypothetical protein